MLPIGYKNSEIFQALLIVSSFHYTMTTDYQSMFI